MLLLLLRVWLSFASFNFTDPLLITITIVITPEVIYRTSDTSNGHAVTIARYPLRFRWLWPQVRLSRNLVQLIVTFERVRQRYFVVLRLAGTITTSSVERCASKLFQAVSQCQDPPTAFTAESLRWFYDSGPECVIGRTGNSVAVATKPAVVVDLLVMAD